jgi:propanol-preferring alcohol dehydrogenase
VVPEDFLYHLSPQLPLAETAPLLCAGIIGYRALRKSELPEKGILGLFGFGSSAHIVMQLAKARGASVFVVTRGEEHRRLAQKMGADWVGQSVYEMPRKLDSAIIFAPAGELVPQALLSLKKGGTLALAGITMSQIPALDYEKHLFYEKSIHSVTSSTRLDAIALLEEASQNQIRPHVTIYPLKEAGRALTDIKADRIQGSAVLEIG